MQQIPLPRSGLTLLLPGFVEMPVHSSTAVSSPSTSVQLKLTRKTRFTVCRRCGDEILLADAAEPEEDVVRWRQHACIRRWQLTLVRTRA